MGLIKIIVGAFMIIYSVDEFFSSPPTAKSDSFMAIYYLFYFMLSPVGLALINKGIAEIRQDNSD